MSEYADVRVLGCQSTQISEYGGVRVLGCQSTQMSDYGGVRVLGFWNPGVSECWYVRILECQCSMIYCTGVSAYCDVRVPGCQSTVMSE